MADSSVFHRRRDSFLSGLGSYAAIVPAGELVTHHADCEYPFRQNSDFWYLTGFDEPNAVALFLPHKPKGEQYVLFVLPKESAAEVWTGFRWGTKGVLANFDVVAQNIDTNLVQQQAMPGTISETCKGLGHIQIWH